MTDAFIKDVLTRTRRIAVVGVSPNPARPSHYVAEYLQQKGYDVVPVNPMHAGKEVFGKTIVATLAEIDPQMGITNAEAAAKAEARGVDVIQDRCPKVEIPRLLW